jgi:hypothetical protein
VRVAVGVLLGEADRVQQVADGVAAHLGAEQLVRLRQGLPDRHAGVQRRVRVLEHDLHVPPGLAQLLFAEPGDVDAVEDHAARGRFHEPQNGPRGRRLAAAGLADQRDRLSLVDVEVHAVDGLDLTDHPLHENAGTDGEVLDEVVHLQHRGHCATLSS